MNINNNIPIKYTNDKCDGIYCLSLWFEMYTILLWSEMTHFIGIQLIFIIYWTFPKPLISATQGSFHTTNYNTYNLFQWISYERYDLYIPISDNIYILQSFITIHICVACVRVLLYYDVFWLRYSSRVMKLIEKYRCSILHNEAWRSAKPSRHTAICFLSNVF